MPACPSCGQENPAEARFCLSCGNALQPAPAPREARKVVTVLFSDVTGSTSLGERLDPETLRRVMARYFDEMRAALEAHGGTVEKFIGDAVMAVFGIPVLHEDDALRAVRAALEMRERLLRLNEELERDRRVTILTRTGVNTGEVVAGEPGADTLITGDPVNVAARLEQAAQPGEILLGDATYRTLRDAIRAEPLAPLDLKGKDEPVAAYRLLEVLPGAEAVRRRLDSPMVGRDRQLALMRDAFTAAVEDRACNLFTIIGSPGVGKSRLVYEFASEVADRAAVLRGRCLPYGDGITYWPVAEVVKEAAGITDEDSGEEAAAKIASLLPLQERDVLVDRLEQALGLADPSAPAAEIAWAFRTFLESLAASRPVVAVFDDIHWAEPTLLDLIDHVTDWSRDAPVMLVSVARQELLDIRPAWGGGKRNATTIQLEPLTEKDCETLVENLLGMTLLPVDAKSRIAEAAEGNPLFVEQVVSMLIDDELLRREDGHWVPTADLSAIPIPPTIHALLAARLDRLAGEERQVIERAAVVGKVFYQGAVAHLAPESLRPGVPSHLMTLVRKEFIRPDTTDFTREPAFRFRHLLIRDAAYAGMPKESRAELHEGFAEWLARAAGDRISEYDEILGYHLEQAYGYRTELGITDDRTRELALRAARHLGVAGRRAMNRSDLGAAERLLQRTVDLLPEDAPERPELLLDLGAVLIDLGEFARANLVIAAVVERARSTGDEPLLLRAELRSAIRTDTTLPWEARRSLAERARPVFEDLDDQRGLFDVHWVSGAIHWTQGRSREAEREIEILKVLANSAGMTRQLHTIIHWRAGSLVWGPTPAQEGLEVCEELLAEGEGSRYVEASVHTTRAALEGMLGREEDCRASGEIARQRIEDVGWNVFTTMAYATRVGIGLEILGDLEAAEAAMRPGMQELHAAGEKGFLSTLAPALGRVLARMGRLDEAWDLALLGREATPSDDLASQLGWRETMVFVLTARGELEEGERLAREAVAMTVGSDYLLMVADAWANLGRVLLAAGRAEEAAESLERALGAYEGKGVLVDAARVRGLLRSE